jgi:hypothetical protein
MAHPRSPVRGPLAAALTALAGTPDHASTVDSQLRSIARLAAGRVGAAGYASITALRGTSPTTVAVSDELVRAVDEAQYLDGDGPCLRALATGEPVAVPDTAGTVQWPRFHEEAPRLGLYASVSVPLYAGRGEAVAVLNLYGRDRIAMAPVLAGICAVHGQPVGDVGGLDDPDLLDEGGRELVAGYAEALSIRATIRLALSVIMNDYRCTAEDAYVSLCLSAGEAGTDLAATAATMITRRT